jgi:hypothetical protein
MLLHIVRTHFLSLATAHNYQLTKSPKPRFSQPQKQYSLIVGPAISFIRQKHMLDAGLVRRALVRRGCRERGGVASMYCRSSFTGEKGCSWPKIQTDTGDYCISYM